MIHLKRFHHIQICIPPGMENEARRFYSGILGLQEIKKPGPLIGNGGLWFRIADIELHIGIELHSNRSKSHPAFEVDDLTGIRNQLILHGINIKEEIVIPNCARFSFFDPFGNRLELLQRDEAIG